MLLLNLVVEKNPRLLTHASSPKVLKNSKSSYCNFNLSGQRNPLALTRKKRNFGAQQRNGLSHFGDKTTRHLNHWLNSFKNNLDSMMKKDTQFKQWWIWSRKIAQSHLSSRNSNACTHWLDGMMFCPGSLRKGRYDAWWFFIRLTQFMCWVLSCSNTTAVWDWTNRVSTSFLKG